MIHINTIQLNIEWVFTISSVLVLFLFDPPVLTAYVQRKTYLITYVLQILFTYDFFKYALEYGFEKTRFKPAGYVQKKRTMTKVFLMNVQYCYIVRVCG